eukprot:5768067-Pyramimonas_sp.AAC.1
MAHRRLCACDRLLAQMRVPVFHACDGSLRQICVHVWQATCFRTAVCLRTLTIASRHPSCLRLVAPATAD